jgi:REP element-mobilizing transposase RayT
MERPHRLERLHIENPVYFITFCTQERMTVLANEQIHSACMGFFAEALKREIFVGRYILMPDHIHLFVKLPPPAENLSDWVKSLKNYLSKELRKKGVPSPHWQKGFFDHVLRSSFQRILLRKMALRGRKLCPSRSGKRLDGLAISGRNSCFEI